MLTVMGRQEKVGKAASASLHGEVLFLYIVTLTQRYMHEYVTTAACQQHRSSTFFKYTRQLDAMYHTTSKIHSLHVKPDYKCAQTMRHWNMGESEANAIGELFVILQNIICLTMSIQG